MEAASVSPGIKLLSLRRAGEPSAALSHPRCGSSSGTGGVARGRPEGSGEQTQVWQNYLAPFKKKTDKEVTHLPAKNSVRSVGSGRRDSTGGGRGDGTPPVMLLNG